MKKDKVLNRETGDGSGASVKYDGSHDPGKTGYHKAHPGGSEPDNYRINDGMKHKDESEFRSENSEIHKIGLHSVTGELFSGHPDEHGHKGKSIGHHKSMLKEYVPGVKMSKNAGGSSHSEES